MNRLCGSRHMCFRVDLLVWVGGGRGCAISGLTGLRQTRPTSRGSWVALQPAVPCPLLFCLRSFISCQDKPEVVYPDLAGIFRITGKVPVDWLLNVGELQQCLRSHIFLSEDHDATPAWSYLAMRALWCFHPPSTQCYQISQNHLNFYNIKSMKVDTNYSNNIIL